MVISGHIQNGVVIPDNTLALPDGTAVIIMVGDASQSVNGFMDDQQRLRYLEALAKIDAVHNENPGDSFSGADHDRALYGN